MEWMGGINELIRFFLLAAVACTLTQCATPPEEPLGEPKLEKLEHATLDPEPEPKEKDAAAKAAANLSGDGLAPVSGKEGRIVIRDPQGAMRVNGTLKGGRMNGVWQYFDDGGGPEAFGA